MITIYTKNVDFVSVKMLKLYAVMITKSTFMYNMPHQKTRRKCLHASRYRGHDVCYRNFELIWMKHF